MPIIVEYQFNHEFEPKNKEAITFKEQDDNLHTFLTVKYDNSYLYYCKLMKRDPDEDDMTILTKENISQIKIDDKFLMLHYNENPQSNESQYIDDIYVLLMNLNHLNNEKSVFYGKEYILAKLDFMTKSQFAIKDRFFVFNKINEQKESLLYIASEEQNYDEVLEKIKSMEEFANIKPINFINVEYE